ncbi:hypothetical protein with DUF1995, partial [Prunus dulcis]
YLRFVFGGAFSSKSQGCCCYLHCLPPKTYGCNFSTRKVAAAFSVSRNLKFVANSASRDDNDATASVEFDDVSIPSDYSELLEQARKATDLALKDNKQGWRRRNRNDRSMQLIREFCNRLINPEKATRTRIFFPEASEVKFARESVFEGASFKLDYLTKPSFFEDFGFVEKVKMKDRVKPEDELFLAAYPYFNVNEMLVVEELYKEAVENTSRNLIIFNGELDRIRSGCYPGPWKVFRKVRNRDVCLHQQEAMPSLKEVALDILPSA